MTKCGYVCVIGKPNVGKSSLVNEIFKRKMSIVTDKAQTTRNSIQLIYNDDDAQILFLDTPGIHDSPIAINKFMNKSSFSSIKNANVIVLMIDASKRISKEDEYILKRLPKDNKIIVAYNKIDQTDIEAITKLKKNVESMITDIPHQSIEISVIRHFNINELVTMIKDDLPEGERLYDVNTESSDETFLIAELIRESILKTLKEEVPHSSYIHVKGFEQKEDGIYIYATIIVEKESQKAIMIGKRGAMIKKIGIQSRISIEREFKQHIFLDLTVTVSKNWRTDSKFLKKHDFLGIK